MPDFPQLFGGGQAIGSRLNPAGLDIFFEPRPANHEKHIDDVWEDDEKSQSLEQWIARVLSLFQNLPEEFDLAELAIEQARLRFDLRARHRQPRRRGAGRRDPIFDL